MSTVVALACAAILAAGSLSATASTPTPGAQASPLGPAGRAVAHPEVFGFLPYWQLGDAQLALDLDRLTTLAWFGVEASGEGHLVRRKPSGDVPPGWEGFESQAFRDLQARAQAAGVRVVVTVQRFGWTAGSARRTEALLRDPERRARLARAVASLVAERGLDGVNLDVEPVPPALAAEMVELTRQVRAALDAVRPGLQLTVDVTSSLAGYDLTALTAPDAADAAIVMGYNYRGAGSPVSGSHAPLDAPAGPDLRASMEAALAQVEGARLVMALPWYGRAWTTQSDEARSSTRRGERFGESVNVSYALAASLAEQHGRQFDPAETSAWTVFPWRACESCPETWRQVWYDDPDSFGTKLDATLEAGLGGVAVWALGHEAGREEMWAALRWRLGGRPADVTPPGGTVGLDPGGVAGERDGLPLVGAEMVLRLAASDEEGGSGLAFVRVSLDAAPEPALQDDGSLAPGRTYPATGTLLIRADDTRIGGTEASGPGIIRVQWRDLAGNWSVPATLEVWREPVPPSPAAS